MWSFRAPVEGKTPEGDETAEAYIQAFRSCIDGILAFYKSRADERDLPLPVIGMDTGFKRDRIDGYTSGLEEAEDLGPENHWILTRILNNQATMEDLEGLLHAPVRGAFVWYMDAGHSFLEHVLNEKGKGVLRPMPVCTQVVDDSDHQVTAPLPVFGQPPIPPIAPSAP
ncbi:MAG: hypothetical protein M3O22_07410 [Pseudomonadota bacterium]|nr:hypothetical protein [Pseudomonadota bacterium]